MFSWDKEAELFSLCSLCQLPLNTDRSSFQRSLSFSAESLCLHCVPLFFLIAVVSIWGEWKSQQTYSNSHIKVTMKRYQPSDLPSSSNKMCDWVIANLFTSWRIERDSIIAIATLTALFWIKWNDTLLPPFVNNMHHLSNCFAGSVAGCLCTPHTHRQCKTAAVFTWESCAHFSCLCSSLISEK